MTLTEHIEQFLLAEARWVSVKELCTHFDINGRSLRRSNGKPGLASGFAISSNQGLKHIAWATDKEFTAYYHRIRTHSIDQLVGLRSLRKHRSNLIERRAKLLFEQGSNQSLFPGL